MHQLAAQYIEDPSKNCVALLDGDQSQQLNAHLRKFTGYCGGDGNGGAKSWGGQRILFLPGDRAPEHWVFEELRKCDLDELSKALDVNDAQLLSTALDCALIADAHSSINEFRRVLGFEGDGFVIWRDCCKTLATRVSGLREKLLSPINKALE